MPPCGQSQIVHGLLAHVPGKPTAPQPETAGGIDIFADRSNQGAAKDRIVTAEEVVAREPELILGLTIASAKEERGRVYRIDGPASA